ncbi:MAG TPA: DUF2339 domain-containing protein, partial [Candidatus Methylacidiphilales bacterium]
NNALYLLLGYASLPWRGANVFPDFAMAFGGVLLVLALIPALRRPDGENAGLALLVEGVAAATLGWMCRWHGTHASLVLGIEAGLLLLASAWARTAARGTALLILGHVCATLAFAMAWYPFFDAASWDGPAVPLLMAALLAVVGVGTHLVFRLRNAADAATAVGSGYLVSLAFLLYLSWVHQCVAEENRFWVLVASGAALFAVQFVRPLRFVNALCAVAWGLAAAAFFSGLGDAGRLTWANGLALAGFLALSQAARRIEAPFMSFEGRALWISAGAAMAWDFVGEKLHAVCLGFSPTLAWALLGGAFFACGLAARERIARWWGLGLLAAALGRVAVVDAWDLGTLSRIFTFLGLGAILLVLGFVYNRYQETMKKWL